MILLNNYIQIIHFTPTAIWSVLVLTIFILLWNAFSSFYAPLCCLHHEKLSKQTQQPFFPLLLSFVFKSLWRPRPLQRALSDSHTLPWFFLSSLILPASLCCTAHSPLCLVEMSGDCCDERRLIFTAFFLIFFIKNGRLVHIMFLSRTNTKAFQSICISLLWYVNCY